jgi:hypothetical protein
VKKNVFPVADTPQQRFFNFKLESLRKNKFFSKMILIYESGPQEDQFHEKKRSPKISWYHPINSAGFFPLHG